MLNASGSRPSASSRTALRQAGDWYHWGPYLSERQWGTVREDYSAGGTAWEYLPHDHARSRAYRWGEDGLAGFSDVEQRLCLALALWNGRDPILKERIFGLTGNQGNHGEDAKEYWWYLDALPSHAWNRWRYHYPQREFPYGDLVAENGRRGKHDPEYELLDTGAFDDDRYWIVEVDYAKADPHDLLMSIWVTNAGPEADDAARAADRVVPQHVGVGRRRREAGARGRRATARVVTEHPFLGPLELVARTGDADRALLRERDEHGAAVRLAAGDRAARRTGSTTTSSPAPATVATDAGHEGRVLAPSSRSSRARRRRVRLRLRPAGRARAVGATSTASSPTRLAEADEFYAELTPGRVVGGRGARPAPGARAGCSGASSSTTTTSRAGSTATRGSRRPPASRLGGRNTRWRTFDAFDIMSMPDKWEYPWFAAWDLAFHCVALAHVDPAFAKYQLVLLCREWFQHPNGALAAYEWSFDDVNPPVQAWAALEVFAIDGGRDLGFLSRVFDKLLVNFTWWINREGPPTARTCSRAGSSASTTSARSTARTCRPASCSSRPTAPAGWASTR